jgi:hypothetical protein
MEGAFVEDKIIISKINREEVKFLWCFLYKSLCPPTAGDALIG